MNSKTNRLFLLLGIFFLANALLAEFIGVKIFSLEQVFGLKPANMTFFGVHGLNFNLTAGVLIWPFVFVMTDIINEYFGRKGVLLLSYLGAGIILYAFLIELLTIKLPASSDWVIRQTAKGPLDMNQAFNAIFSQSNYIIAGSLVAFIIGQVVDVTVFHHVKKYTGHKMIWLRSTGSTLVSQLIDSFVVLYIGFYLGANWSLALVLALGLTNYIYKCAMAIILTPLIYIVHGAIDRYLGHKVSHELMEAAALS